MNGKLPLSLLFVAVLAFACGPRARSEARSAARSNGAPVARSANASLTPSLAVSVEDGVRFAFAVENQGAKKLEVKFRDGRTHDLVVLDSLGREVWRWSEGKMFTQAMQAHVLRTSDALRYEGEWEAPGPGRYVAVATLASMNYPMERKVEFEVRGQ